MEDWTNERMRSLAKQPQQMATAWLICAKATGARGANQLLFKSCSESFEVVSRLH